MSDYFSSSRVQPLPQWHSLNVDRATRQNDMNNLISNRSSRFLIVQVLHVKIPSNYQLKLISMPIDKTTRRIKIKFNTQNIPFRNMTETSYSVGG